MKGENFRKLVREAVLSLPENIRKKMDNIDIVVEKGSPRGSILGLYEGVPKTAWGRDFGMMLPDKITIFQAPIERMAKNSEEVREIVRETVYHEIAHHFGFSEKGVRELEKKRNNKLKK